MNPSFGSRERRSRTTLSRGSRMAQFQGFRQGQRRRSLFLHSSALFFFSFDSVRPERSANASSVTRSARADSGFASTRVASKTSGRVALPRRDNFMAPEGAARGPVRYVPCSEIPTRVSFLSSVFFKTTSFAALEPRGRTRAGGGRSSRRASTSRPRLVSRTDSSGTESIVPRSPRPEPPPPGRTCRLSSAAFRLHRGRHCDVVLFTK